MYRKPKIGLLGLMTEGYELIFPGINNQQLKYADELIEKLSPVADISFAGLGLNRGEVERIVKQYNAEEVDGILIILFTYSPGNYMVSAMKYNHLPLAMAIVQPDQEVLDDWVELDLTRNQGVHGAQDNANAIIRCGHKLEIFAGNRHEQPFVDFVEDFARAAYACTKLRNMRTGVLSRMGGMADILMDDFAFFRKIGPELCYDTVGSVYSRMQEITKHQIDDIIALDHERFNIDPNLTKESHEIAVRIYLGFKKWLDDNGYEAYTAQFDQFAADGRFRQLPLYAASNLLAEGYGYAAEGDMVCASMVAAANILGNMDANFTEMYTMDFEKEAIIFCHAGEGNWNTCRSDMKPNLIDRYLGEGGLENPPTHIFTPQFGSATLTALVALEGNKFRLVLARGEILPKSDLKGCEMPYFFWHPESGMTKCVENWSRYAGTHHEVINIGDVSHRWKMLSNMLGIEYVEV